MMPRLLWLALLAGLPMLGGCRRNPPPAPDPSAAGAEPTELPRVAPSLPPLQMAPLAQEPARRVLLKLISAHYDPASLGLQSLAFKVDLRLPQIQTKMQGSGTWKKGAPVEVKVRQVERKGQVERKPADPGIGQQVWTSLQLQTEGLLEGIGAGYLQKRLEAWQKVQAGESKLEGDRLLLIFNEESGRTVVTVAPGYLITRVENQSPRKVTRSMEYQHRLLQGRNLITQARMGVELGEGADVPAGALKMLKASDGLTFRIDYADAGGYQLPVRLRKTSSRGDEVVMELRYTRVH